MKPVKGTYHPVLELWFDNWHFQRRAREIAFLALKGLSNKEIAVQLGIGRESVSSHLKVIYAKADCGYRGGRKELASFFLTELLKE